MVENINTKIPAIAYFLFFVIGYSPWFLVNMLFLELPILMFLPPKEAIASQLALAIQSANVLIPVYLLLRRYRIVTVNRTMGALFLLASLTAFANAYAWSFISPEGEKVNQVYYAVISLSVVAGAIGALSNITFWEFTSHYHPNLISALAVGNAFSSIIPAILAAIQRPGTHDPLFSFTSFFIIGGVLLCFPVASFVAILYTQPVKGIKREKWADESRKLRPHLTSAGSVGSTGSLATSDSLPTSPTSSPLHSPPATRGSTFSSHLNNYSPTSSPAKRGGYPPSPSVDLHEEEGNTAGATEDSPLLLPSVRSPSGTYTEKRSVSRRLTFQGGSDDAPDPDYLLPEASTKDLRQAWRELLVMFWISCVTYCLPSIMTYLLMGYSDTDQFLMYTTISGMVGSTLGRIFSGFVDKVPHMPLIVLQLVTGAVFFLGAPLSWERWLAWMTVSAYFVFTFQYGLQSTVLFKTASMHIDSRYAQSLCRWLGVVGQAGALTSATICYILVHAGAFA